MNNAVTRYAVTKKACVPAMYFSGFSHDQSPLFSNAIAEAVTWEHRFEAEAQAALLIRFGGKSVQRRAVTL